MSDRFTGSTGTSLIGGTEAHTSRSLPALILPIAVLGAALALVPLWLGYSRVLMGVAVLGLAFAVTLNAPVPERAQFGVFRM